MSDAAPEVKTWARLSPWSILHFAARGIAENAQMAYWLVPAMLGASITNRVAIVWSIPFIAMALVIVWAVLDYRRFSYRLLDSAVQVRQGVIVRKQLDLPFERIQNVNFEAPFYFRPLGLVTIRIDGAGSATDEVYLGALTLQQAESIRRDIIVRKRQLAAAAGEAGTVESATSESGDAAEGPPWFSRSLGDLIVYGLTNNRAFLVLGGVFAFLSQTPLSFERIFRSAGLDLGEYLAAQSITRLAILLLVSFIVVMTVLAVLSVFASIATWYRFSIHRSGDSFIVRRGLFNRHEVHVRKSRIQLVHYSQDWLDFLLGRRNVVFEQISHAAPGSGAAAAPQTSRTLVPAVKLHDTRRLVDGIMPGVDVDGLDFAPVSKLYFYKHALITTLLYAIVGIVTLLQDFTPMRLILLLWPFHLALVHLRWRRAGLAVHGESIVARSGVIGINYHIVPAFKVQQARHLQSRLMKRRGVSSIRLQTAASAVAVPYLNTTFARSVIDYCLYRVESTRRSWM